LYNTYWVRYPAAGASYEQAVENSRRLFTAAGQAGVRRVVHVSITNPSEDSPFGYFRGKALVEKALCESGLSHAILRPAVLFGDEGILFNNIAWLLRHLPVFGVFGDGQYRLQPIFVDDMAELAVTSGRRDDNLLIDAIGPETFTYRQLVSAIGQGIGKNRPMLSLPPRLGYAAAWVLGKLLGDVMLTWEEVGGLMAGLLATDSPPAGRTPLTKWLADHGHELGRRYANELARRRHAEAVGHRS
jgi:uncharacterized protein YbjT (DUF2867 family)